MLLGNGQRNMVVTDFSGNFTNPDNCKEGDIGTVIDEGKIEDKKNLKDEPYKQLSFKIEVSGKELIHSPRMMEGQKLAKAWGKDSKNWVGKQFTCHVIRYRSYGQEKKCVEIEPLVEKK